MTQLPTSAFSDGKPSEITKINEFAKRREKAGLLKCKIAGVGHSDMFKGDVSGKPLAKRWDHHYTTLAQRLGPCALKAAAKYLKTPGIISLGGGLPSSEYFPLEEILIRAQDVSNKKTERGESSAGLLTGSALKHDIENGVSEMDMAISLNYGQSCGQPPLIRFLTEHVELLHDPPYADWACTQTIGSTGSLEQALRLFCEAEYTDSVLVEAYSFSTAIETIHSLGLSAVPVPMDAEGLVPEEMANILDNWQSVYPHVTKPLVLYTIPSGQNPTGATQSLARRRAIYEVCQKYDIYILEDDPYYFLQMPEYNLSDGQKETTSLQGYLDSLVPSYVSIDVDGRVMRHDTFSKILFPGARMGWITASSQIVERFERLNEHATQGPNGLTQLVVYKLLEETWGGHEGFLKWLMHMRDEYTQRRDALLKACETHLPTIVQYSVPRAGMFLWMHMDYTQHPLYRDYEARKKNDGEIEAFDLEALEEKLFLDAVDQGVLIARGSWFRADHEKPLEQLCFRATFAAASYEAMATAIDRFSATVRKSFALE